MDYTGTSKPVMLRTWLNAAGQTVRQFKCPAGSHNDYYYTVDGVAITAPIDPACGMYRTVPGISSRGDYRHGKYINIQTGEEWDVLKDSRVARA